MSKTLDRIANFLLGQDTLEPEKTQSVKLVRRPKIPHNPQKTSKKYCSCGFRARGLGHFEGTHHIQGLKTPGKGGKLTY